MKRSFWFPLLIVIASPLLAQQPTPCEAPEYRQFDFWIGEWEVKNPDGSIAGHNKITSVNNGCALLEEWTSATGGPGKSLNAYHQKKGRWQQFWVDMQTILQLEGGFANGAMTMSAQGIDSDGGSFVQKIVWTPNADGTVRQHWQRSEDAGETWTTVFDGMYHPMD